MNTLIGKYLFAFFLISTTYYGVRAQLTTVNFEASQDSHIDSRLAITNFGSNSSMAARTYVYSSGRRGGGGGQYYQRSYVKFNLDGIPENAIIYSAELKLTRATSVVGENPFRVKRVTSSWSETLITSSNRPSVSTLSNDICSSYTTSGSVESFDVKDMVQRLVYGQVTDYGWSVEVENEYTGGTSGAIFHSREVGSQSLRPKLEVKYYLPLELSVVTVNHASSSTATDGSISIGMGGGASSGYTYSWINGSTGATIGSARSINGVGYGWYGLHVTGNEYGEEFYQAFLLGADCEEVTIDFVTSPEYTDNAYLRGHPQYDDQNYGGYSTLLASVNSSSGVWHETRSLMKFNLWVDPSLAINEADLTLQGSYHVLGSGNQANLSPITGNWSEGLVTWNKKPTIENGITMPSTTTFNQDYTADISSFFNDWKLDPSSNKGICFRLKNTSNYNHQIGYYSPSVGGVSNRPVIQFKVQPTKTYTSVTLNTVDKTGLVNVDISDVCQKTAPYYYFISEGEPAKDPHDIYVHLRDSVFDGDLDSLKFYAFGESTNTKSFENISYGKHFVSVFDATGSRLFDEAVVVHEDLVFTNQTGLSASGLTLTANQNNAKGNLQLYVDEKSDYASIEFEVSNTNPGGDQFFGLINSDVVVQSETDMEFGFSLKSGNLYAIKNNTETIVGGITLVDGMKFRVSIENGKVGLYANEALVNTISLPDTYTYGVAVKMQKDSKYELVSGGKWENKPYLFTNASIDANCGDKFAKVIFGIKLPNIGMTQQSNYEFQYLLTPEGGGQGGSGTIPLGTLLTSGVYLLPGVYSLTGIISTTSGNFVMNVSETIRVGYKVSWNTRSSQYVNTYPIAPNSNSVVVNGSNESNYQYANSLNIMKYNSPGWIEFDAQTIKPDGYSYLRFTTTNIDEDPDQAGLGLFNEGWVQFYKPSNGYNVYVRMYTENAGPGSGFSPLISLPPYGRYRIEFDDNTPTRKIHLYWKDDHKATLNRGNSSVLVRCNSKFNGDGFKNIVTSFGCPVSEDMYAHLKPKLDGYYHIMKDSKINFVFDQEYDAEDLEYNIYNVNDQLIRTQSDYPALATTYGDNYLTIDVSNGQNALGKGFYYLEVINSKKKKSYMRFHID